MRSPPLPPSSIRQVPRRGRVTMKGGGRLTPICSCVYCEIMYSIMPGGAMDSVSQERRSQIMGRVRNKDTRPEIRVRRLLHAMGYRFRLHRKDLPGKPDVVLPKWRTVVLIHGCFWH